MVLSVATTCALVYQEIGDLEQAQQQWETAVREEPRFRAAWRGLFSLAWHVGDDAGAAELLDRMKQHPELETEAIVVQCELHSRRGDHSTAQRQLIEAVRQFPRDPFVLSKLCEYLFESQEYAAAQHHLEQLVELTPNDASVFHNLALTHLRMDDRSAAKHAAEKALAIAPNREDTIALARELNQTLRSDTVAQRS